MVRHSQQVIMETSHEHGSWGSLICRRKTRSCANNISGNKRLSLRWALCLCMATVRQILQFVFMILSVCLSTWNDSNVLQTGLWRALSEVSLDSLFCRMLFVMYHFNFLLNRSNKDEIEQYFIEIPYLPHFLVHSIQYVLLWYYSIGSTGSISAEDYHLLVCWLWCVLYPYNKMDLSLCWRSVRG
jgi:hypothetical protein